MSETKTRTKFLDAVSHLNKWPFLKANCAPERRQRADPVRFAAVCLISVSAVVSVPFVAQKVLLGLTSLATAQLPYSTNPFHGLALIGILLRELLQQLLSFFQS